MPSPAPSRSVRALRVAIAVATTLLVVAGCSFVDDGAAGPGVVASAPSPSARPTDPDRPGPPAPAPEQGRDAGGCDTVVREAVDAVIGDQLAAFADGDYAHALTFATPGFRDQFDPASFEALISTSFPVPATADGHDVTDCQTRDGLASATVLVTGRPGTQVLVYGLLRVDGAWLIDGAVPLVDDGGPVI